MTPNIIICCGFKSAEEVRKAAHRFGELVHPMSLTPELEEACRVAGADITKAMGDFK